MRAAPFSVLALLGANAALSAPADYPHAPVPFTDVKVTGGFWAPRLETNRTVTVWYDFENCEKTGRIANFARAGGLEQGGFQGIAFNDSDVFKVIEGAAYTLALKPDPKLDTYLDDLIAKIAAAQEDDGYLYAARTLGFVNGMTGPERWSHLAHSHELYNVGHMYEAAVAHHQATGKRSLLDVAVKNADLLVKVFGPKEGQRKDVPGHEEIEIGLAKLYRETGTRAYLDLAEFFVDMRGREDVRKRIYGAYSQDHRPVVEQREAVGHAVRAGYLYAGVADVAALTGGKAYVEAIGRIWEDVVTKKMHLTGGIGASRRGEAFGKAYDLPNATAYLETCAAIANALWNQRMFLLHGDAKYVDVLERTIYNGFLAGIALSGDRFFYPNPLASDNRRKFNQGALDRKPWFGCSCCPVNVVRFIPSIPGYVYARRGDALYVNLFLASKGVVTLPAGAVKLTQETDYPWEGKVRIVVRPAAPVRFALHVRIPGWVEGRPVPGDLYRYADPAPAAWTLRVNGEAVEAKRAAGYAVIDREWKDGDAVALDLPMPVRRVLAHDAVAADRGRVALERGPIVYCVEGADNGGRVLNRVLPDDAPVTVERRPDLLGGVTVLRAKAQAASAGADGKPATEPADLVAIPYYAWCHRGANEMTVWLPRTVAGADVPPPPTLASAGRVSASHCFGSDATDAVNDQKEPASSGDHDVPRMTWWDHKGTAEWLQLDFAKPAKVGAVSVYWFDDTGRGQCRVPASWTLHYLDGGDWKAVQGASAFGVEKDRFNRTPFDPVTTKALRMRVQLQEGVSGGVLEWKVEEAK